MKVYTTNISAANYKIGEVWSLALLAAYFVGWSNNNHPVTDVGIGKNKLIIESRTPEETFWIEFKKTHSMGTDWKYDEGIGDHAKNREIEIQLDSEFGVALSIFFDS